MPDLLDAPARPATPVRTPSRSLVFAIIALVGAVLACGILGASAVPMEANHGRNLTDTPADYQLFATALLASMLVWSVLGLIAIVFGIVDAVRHGARRNVIAAVIIAVLAPEIALVVLLGAMAASAALL